MAVAVRSASTGTASASGAVSVAAPAGVQAADLLVAIHFEDVFGSVAAMTAAGWTQAGSTYTGGVTGNGSCHVKVWTAAGSTSAPYSFGQDDTSCVTVLAISGQDGTTPVNVAPTFSQSGSSQASGVAPAVTPSVDNALLICGFGTTANSGTPTWTPPAGMAEQSDLFAAFATAEVAALVLTGGSGVSTGTKTGTVSVTTVNEHTTVSLVIAPAGAGGATPNPRPPVVVTRQPTRAQLAGRFVTTNSVPFSVAADAAARQVPYIPVQVITARPVAARPNPVVLVRTPSQVQVAVQTGTATFGLAGTGLEVASVLSSSRTLVVTAQRHPAWSALPQSTLVATPLQPVTVTAETGTAALGLSAAGNQSSIRALSGAAALGGSGRGTAVKATAQAGATAAGLVGVGVDKKSQAQAGAAALGVAGTGQAVKKTAQVATAALPLYGRHSGLVAHAVAGSAALGLAGSANQVKVAVRAGLAALGLAPRATQAKTAAPAGVAALGAVGRGTLSKSVTVLGRDTLGLSVTGVLVHVAVGSGSAAVGLSGDALTVFVLTFRPAGGTVVDGAVRYHTVTVLDDVERDLAGTVVDDAVHYRAGVPV